MRKFVCDPTTYPDRPTGDDRDSAFKCSHLYEDYDVSVSEAASEVLPPANSRLRPESRNLLGLERCETLLLFPLPFPTGIITGTLLYQRKGIFMAQTTPPSGPRTDWDIVATNPEFRELMAAKARFIVPATIFFIVYYFALPILVGYAPEFMKTRVIGPLNFAYVFALSQFFMAWIIAGLYMRAAGRFDAKAKRLIEHLAETRRLEGK